MTALARDLDFSSGVFAALATVLFVMCYGAPASWVRTFLLLKVCHGYSFLSTQWMGLLPPARRKMIEHLLHVLIESLDVFLGLVGEGFTGLSPPKKLLTVRVEQIDNQGTDRVVGNCGRDISESPPAPAASKAVIVGVESWMILGHLDGQDGDVAARLHRRPTFRCQGGIDGSFDPVDP